RDIKDEDITDALCREAVRNITHLEPGDVENQRRESTIDRLKWRVVERREYIILKYERLSRGDHGEAGLLGQYRGDIGRIPQQENDSDASEIDLDRERGIVEDGEVTLLNTTFLHDEVWHARDDEIRVTRLADAER